MHGVMFNNEDELRPGTFQSLAALGPSNGVRVIAPNRREYDGSTPHPDVLELLMNGSEAEKEAFIAEMGRDFALLIAGLVESLSLPGGVAVAGWSLGSLVLMAVVASMESLPEDTRRTLSSSVRSIILYQAPAVVFGVPIPEGMSVPQTDPEVSPAGMGPFFARWATSFFLHGDLSTRDLRNLTYSRTDPNRPPTFDTIPMDGILDLTAGAKADAMVVSPSFAAATAKLTDKALFDAHVRGRLWKNSKFYLVTGSMDNWTSIYAGWKIEERMLVEAKPECEITFELVDGANHFFFMEEPQRSLNCFKRWFGN
ncbi:unnamed protein product [Mycena citricolor]|uniref:AB hydrolase-1 domain-containing protein n=1 Tax=Mycena citricolor TaxID=2018698 RepID=A0AAD2HAT0_9AGAR|nr:unnamed protein product [Mycena citricolor]